MAIIKYKSGRRQMVSEKQGTQLWLCINGHCSLLTHEQVRFMNSVDEVILNWRTAPDEYIKMNFEEVAPKIVATWRVDSNGKPSRPDYGPELRFAEKWGLWSRGRQTKLAEDAVESIGTPKRYRQKTLSV